MSTNVDHSEFEHWLRQETDRHRLYADESVWERINRRVHKRRWFPFVLTALLTISASVTWVMIDQPDLPLNYAARMHRTNSAEKIIPQAPLRKDQIKLEQPSLSFLMQAQQMNAASSPETTSEQSWMEEIENTQDKIMPVPTDNTELFVAEAKGLIQQEATVSNHSLVVDPSPADANAALSEAQTTSAAAEKTNVLHPEQFQSIESVINGYKGKRTKKSWRMQWSVSPTISYRQLIEDVSALQAARSVMNAAPAMAVPELESVVNHKPDLGLQFGVSVSRQLSKQLDFVGGVQFNINKYDIRAYKGGREVATVGLNNQGGTGSVSSYTNYRSADGIWAKWLANYYFSLSAPIGFQYRVIGNKKWSWGLGSTIQPTYVLSKQAYMLSADYKNYLEVPSLVRRWNLNGQVETFVGFQKGKTRWTLGPQARYQIFSSYEKSYPVQEHLFDIGIRLGVGL
ncbi:MAG: hypothetical protein RL750_208 [Bacteroidota bacterium]